MQQQATLRERELQMEAQKQQMQAQADMQERQHKAELDAHLKAQDIEFQKWKAMLDAEVRLATAQISASKGADENTSGAADQSAAMLQAIIERMSAPKTIVRGPDGSIQGIA